MPAYGFRENGGPEQQAFLDVPAPLLPLLLRPLERRRAA